jgi:tryptophan 2,3-dioxygenase
MTQPAIWRSDPACGHDVTATYQTHYCTYIRVPRLLGLTRARAPGALFLQTAYQWQELWFKVLLVDLRAALADDCTTYEPVKLLRRGAALFQLFAQHLDLAESGLVRELRLTQAIRAPGRVGASAQLAELAALARRLPRLGRETYPGLAEAVQEYLAHFRAFRARFQKFTAATLVPQKTKAPAYADWLRLPQLLALQDGPKADWTASGGQPAALMAPERLGPDENMFIIVHQCFEVWFQVMLDHVDRAVPLLAGGKVNAAARLLARVAAIQKLLVTQIQIPATMLPLDFLRFRSQTLERGGQVYHTGLSPASGTESYQFREIEIVCGLRDDPVFRKYLAGTDALPIRLLTPRQRERLGEMTLPEAFRRAADARGVGRYDELFTPADVPNPNADLAALGDTLLAFDEFFRFWRLGHVSMVEKMIGAKSGTGFLGPEYLMETAGIKVQEKNRVFPERQFRPRFFEELWAVRTRMSS